MSGRAALSSTCLICCPLPYAGRGWPQTCVEVSRNFPSAGIEPVLVTPRLRKPVPPAIRSIEGMSFPYRMLPWRVVRDHAHAALEMRFERLLAKSDPTRTIAYFWPGSSPRLAETARRLGILTVREMINTYQGTAKRILDHAYNRLNLPRTHTITDEAVHDEREELALYDHVFAPSPLVKASLIEAGVPEARIILSSYGWSPERFGAAPVAPRAHPRPFQALFVGLACVRKGVPELLEAWQKSGIQGELLVVGDVEPVLQSRLEAAVATGKVRHLPFTKDVAALYRNADLFVFPSHEEGCPQVTLEAAGCGLPVLTTPMGAAALVRDGVNGLVISEGDVDGLTHALRLLACDGAMRQRFASRIVEDARRFTYERVSAERGRIIAGLLPEPRRSVKLVQAAWPATA